MHMLCRYIDDELMELEHKVEQAGKLTDREVDYGDKLAHFEKCLLTNKAMKGSYSENRGRSYDYTGRSYGMVYHDDMSYERNRDSQGRYSRDGFLDKLMEMRAAAPNDKSRRAVERMIDELEN